MDLLRHLSGAHSTNHEEYRRTVLTLQSGAVGLSFGLLGLELFKSDITSLWSLYACWVTGGLGIVGILLSFNVVDRSLSAYMSSTTTRILVGSTPESQSQREDGSRLASRGEQLNWVGGIALVVSMCFLAFFVISNVRKPKMPDDPRPIPVYFVQPTYGTKAARPVSPAVDMVLGPVDPSPAATVVPAAPAPATAPAPEPSASQPASPLPAPPATGQD